jgi:hypothetical protein
VKPPKISGDHQSAFDGQITAKWKKELSKASELGIPENLQTKKDYIKL